VTRPPRNSPEYEQSSLPKLELRESGPRQEVLTGQLERITFNNPENGFLIGRLRVEGSGEEATVRGVLPGLLEGERVKLWGEWEDHPTYGPQFKAHTLVILDPNTLEGMAKYLELNIEGIGPTLAKRIVKTFGLETFALIDKEPERLLEVPKLSRKVLDNIAANWGGLRAKRDILVFLHSVGISALFADRIFTAYGLASVETVKDNPYRLAMEVQGIGFRTADQIARNLGFALDAPPRIEAGVLHTLDEAGQEGHTGLPLGLLVATAGRLLEVAPQPVADAAERLRAGGLLALEEMDSEATDSALAQRRRMRRAEEAIAGHLERIAAGEAFTRFKEIAATVTEMERSSGLYLSPAQRTAVEEVLQHKILIITGGPGTGKTTIIRFILGLVAGSLPSVVLAAPTGKAAKRMGEATGQPSSTIHRLLEAGPRGFGRTAERQLETELVIIDESSMIDTVLMAALLEAIPDHARLVLVGDVDQLPSVGPGRVLGDLIESGRLPVARLEQIFRQSRESRITANAHAIRRGELPDLTRPEGETLTDFYFMEEDDPARIVDRMRGLLLERIPQRFGLDPKTQVQVLSPMHRGLTGAQNLNRMLQEWLNPSGPEITLGEQPYRVGDKVMQTRNDYEKEVFNGDMGEITGFDAGRGELLLDFDGREVRLERKGLDTLTLGYAITVHKSQGSEYPAVVLPLTTHHAIMLQRNLLYTAITRGKNLVVILGTRKALAMAVNNSRPVVRHTGLRTRLGVLAPFPADKPVEIG